MSKIYKKYKNLKEEDNNTYYLFESGIFYLFIEKDAEKISKILPLKLTHLNDEIYKCGFPKKSIDKYRQLFIDNNIQVKIINKEEKKYTLDFCLKIINEIKNVNIENTTPIEALMILKELKENL